MNNVVKTIKEYGTFFIASVDNGAARVRPFGSVCEIEGKGYLCSNNTKDFYKQVKENPRVELCAMGKNGTWLRVAATLVEVDDVECKRLMLEDPTGPKSIYKDPSNPIFVVFRMDDVDAREYSFTGVKNIEE